MADEEMVMLGLITAVLTPGEAYRTTFHGNAIQGYSLPPTAYMNSRQSYPPGAFTPTTDSYFRGLAMHGGDRIAYQQALRRARPIITQWSEWERQTRMEAWR
jgi:hypothetical protein